MPGETALTRMPREAYSIANDLVAAATPPLVSAVSTDGALRQPEESHYIDAHDRSVVRSGVVGERLGDVGTGVIDQRVDAPEAREGLADDPVRGCGLGELAR